MENWKNCVRNEIVRDSAFLDIVSDRGKMLLNESISTDDYDTIISRFEALIDFIEGEKQCTDKEDIKMKYDQEIAVLKLRLFELNDIRSKNRGRSR